MFSITTICQLSLLGSSHLCDIIKIANEVFSLECNLKTCFDNAGLQSIHTNCAFVTESIRAVPLNISVVNTIDQLTLTVKQWTHYPIDSVLALNPIHREGRHQQIVVHVTAMF